MSQGTPIHALNNQTNINGNRYFFATQEAGEQELFVSTLSGGGPLGNISSLAVGISGPAGNAVVVSEAPTFIASEFVSADQGLAAGGTTYWTLSSLSTSLAGISISADRSPGTGIACIESYGANGSTGGFEFLSRGLNSALDIIGSPGVAGYISSIGRPGATAVLGASGTLVTGEVRASDLTSLDEPSDGSGRNCFLIQDLSGSGGVVPTNRWAIGTTGVPTGGNVGSDFIIRNYTDGGSVIGEPMSIRRSDGAMAINNLSSINGVPFDLSGVLPWEVYTVLNTGTQAVSLTAGTPQTVLTFTDIPAPAQGVNAGGLAMSVPIAVSNTGLTSAAIVNMNAYYGGSASGGSGVAATLALSSNLNSGTVTLSGVAIHNGSSNTLLITAVTDTTGTYNFTQGTSAFHKFFFQPVF